MSVIISTIVPHQLVPHQTELSTNSQQRPPFARAVSQPFLFGMWLSVWRAKVRLMSNVVANLSNVVANRIIVKLTAPECTVNAIVRAHTA